MTLSLPIHLHGLSLTYSGKFTRGVRGKKSLRHLFNKISQTNFFCLGFLLKNSVVIYSVWRVCVLPQFLGLETLRSIAMFKFCSSSIDETTLNKLVPNKLAQNLLKVLSCPPFLQWTSMVQFAHQLFSFKNSIPLLLGNCVSSHSNYVVLIQAANDSALTTGIA